MAALLSALIELLMTEVHEFKIRSKSQRATACLFMFKGTVLSINQPYFLIP